MLYDGDDNTIGLHPSRDGAPFRTLGDLLIYERMIAPTRRHQLRAEFWRGTLFGLTLGAAIVFAIMAHP